MHMAMKRRFLTALLALLLIFCCTGAACSAKESVEGTYFLFVGGEYEKNFFYKLYRDKWSYSDGSEGRFEVRENEIIFYVTHYGREEKYLKGSVGGGKLTVPGRGGTLEFYIYGCAPEEERGGISDWQNLAGHTHDWGEWKTVVPATCTTAGVEMRLCKADNAHKQTKNTQPDPEAHKWENGKCKYCGKIKPAYILSADGGKIYFGEYPKTEVKDEKLKSALDWLAGATPDYTFNHAWKDYGYFKSGKVQSYMWYNDVTYEGERYRGVFFTSYRPNHTTYVGDTEDNSYQHDNGYRVNTKYWFKYEPIEWRVLSRQNGKALLMADSVLDCMQYFSVNTKNRVIDGKTVFPNNYAESDIREWLNGAFYSTAFGNTEKNIIELTEVKNGLASTGDFFSEYICENTEDKVFLLSWHDMVNAEYGFNPNAAAYGDSARLLNGSDYAKSLGLRETFYRDKEYSTFWLRSPYQKSSKAYVAYYDGALDNADVVRTEGVVPALQIRL